MLPQATARLRLSVALAALALVTVACAWSVPADPGANARTRSRTTPLTSGPQAVVAAPGRSADPGTEAVYLARCGQCHAPFPPSYASAEEWPAFVRRYGPRAGLFGADRSRVLGWLQASAR